MPPDITWQLHDFQIDPSRPLYEQFVEQIRAMIAKGQLPPGTRLPSVRDTAASLRVNPTTVMKAYQELERLSLLVTFRGQGTFVTDAPDAIQRSRRELARAAVRSAEELAASIGLTLNELIALAQEEE
ncbi:GntR family transcriptional regulator [Paenibacillus sp. MMS18-CY102]|uniref:GntR family transcriptional regulator n=1 Tax=Paenibacillus sp. MMS18-CY102 TaxID=2682849 RepID=UPI001365F4FE|nr:GntR family transcriptional regulator [Paenibacillus sp. MMS18-CY102]MWC27776.1 GntR family transcriptional regulator [Paenibacillus sp. MMS18-CY102]